MPDMYVLRQSHSLNYQKINICFFFVTKIKLTRTGFQVLKVVFFSFRNHKIRNSIPKKCTLRPLI